MGAQPCPDEDQNALILQAQGGDLSAMERLFERYHAHMYRYLLLLLGESGAGRELTLETFWQIWEALPGLHDPMQFVLWLYRIATNLAYDERSTLPITSRYQWQALPPDMARILGDVGQLPWPEHPCLLLHLLMGFTESQIADCLGLQEKQVTQYIERSVEALLPLKELRQMVQGVPIPLPSVTSPFLPEHMERRQERRPALLLASTRPFRQRRFLQLCTRIGMPVLLVVLLTSSGLLFWLNRPVQPAPKGEPLTPPSRIFDPAHDRLSCYFNEVVNQPSSICSRHLYQDINQSVELGPYKLRVEQIYADVNMIGLAYSLLYPRASDSDDNVMLHMSLHVGNGLTIPLQAEMRGRNQSIPFKNALFKIAFYYLSLPLQQIPQKANASLQISQVTVLRTDNRDRIELLRPADASLRINFPLTFHAGRAITPMSQIEKSDLLLESVIASPGNVQILLRCLHCATTTKRYNYTLVVGNDVAIATMVLTGKNGTELHIYFQESFDERNERWQLIITEASAGGNRYETTFAAPAGAS
ncbi:DNA-directed RNA polymerase specialized sigma24 family protein [Thermosporothrix hazakensis]|jgi:DNA-directed RNA polymerase specialized sigma24 family protein|uniref:DNA-directed RNA polymerase specialized sigma24 family protein n=1 Tax=Thermosporothrix hazakensis TaxID=644383 RepID=A0A326UF47_THEHA|nr:RNA polymerase sigma factor [Thermosporothrix hazakensis]PZW36501.1 DNA-directed RNA polymerase specialized sigma24 family protein [Thermosporothrix hazakensis]GCE47154.1 hypothetical protein KTH_20230 [Thermosporothrix hazakensis]